MASPIHRSLHRNPAADDRPRKGLIDDEVNNQRATGRQDRLGLSAKLPRSCELCGQQPVQSVPFSRVQISVHNADAGPGPAPRASRSA